MMRRDLAFFVWVRRISLVFPFLSFFLLLPVVYDFVDLDYDVDEFGHKLRDTY